MTGPTTPRERIAQALYYAPAKAMGLEGIPWERQDDETREAFLRDADVALEALAGSIGDAEAWQHNAKLHNDMRRRIQRVATHAAAEQRTLSWVADELVDILDDPKAWHGETVDADQIAALRDGLTARHIVPGDNPAADALAAIDTARSERDARNSVLKDVIAQREQAIRVRETAGTEAARALAQAERERDEAREKLGILDKHTDTFYAQQWARLAKGLRGLGITPNLVGLEKAVTVTLDAIDVARAERDAARQQRDVLWRATGIGPDKPVEFVADAILNMVNTARLTRTQLRPQLARAEADADDARERLRIALGEAETLHEAIAERTAERDAARRELEQLRGEVGKIANSLSHATRTPDGYELAGPAAWVRGEVARALRTALAATAPAVFEAGETAGCAAHDGMHRLGECALTATAPATQDGQADA